MYTSRIRRHVAAAAAAISVLGGTVMLALPASAHATPALPFAVASTATDNSANGDCGSVDLTAAPTDSGALSTAMKCFQQAYSSCETAQLRASWDGAVEKVARTISITPTDGSCMVVDFVTRSNKASGADVSDTFRCSSVSFEQAGLLIRGCGADGDILIPKPVAALSTPAR